MVPRDRRGNALAALLDCAADAPPTADELDQLLTAARGQRHLSQLVERFLSDPAALRRASTVALIARLGAPDLFRLLPAAVGDDDARVALAAAAALHGLADRAPSSAELHLAVHAAAGRYGEHRRSDVLDALILAHARSPVAAQRGLPEWFSDPDHPALMGLRRVLRRAQHPRARWTAWRWLKHPSLAGAASEQLTLPAARAADAAALSPLDWLSQSHLVNHPARLAALAKLIRPDGSWPDALLPGPDAVTATPVSARLGWVRLIGSVPAAPKRRDAALATRLLDPDPLVRHAAVRAAAALPSRASCLLDFCFDPEPRVRRSAMLAVLNQPERGMVRDAVRERVLAAAAALPDQPAAPPPALAERLRWRGSQTARPATLPAPLAEGLLEGPPADAADAVAQIRGLGLVPLATPHLLDRLGRTTGDDQPAARLAAVIAAALGDSDQPLALGHLNALAADSAAEPRVRANALDAVVRIARRRPPLRSGAASLARSLWTNQPHRLRANAIRAALVLAPAKEHASPDAARALAAMLRDDRPEHRLAALWLAERLAPALVHQPDVIDMVERLSLQGQHAVRDRAERAVERVRLEVRLGWTRRAQAVAVHPAPEEAAA